MELTVDEDNTTADEEYVKAKEEELYKEYTELFADNEKLINRAVMSASIADFLYFSIILVNYRIIFIIHCQYVMIRLKN